MRRAIHRSSGSRKSRKFQPMHGCPSAYVELERRAAAAAAFYQASPFDGNVTADSIVGWGNSNTDENYDAGFFVANSSETDPIDIDGTAEDGAVYATTVIESSQVTDNVSGPTSSGSASSAVQIIVGMTNADTVETDAPDTNPVTLDTLVYAQSSEGSEAPMNFTVYNGGANLGGTTVTIDFGFNYNNGNNTAQFYSYGDINIQSTFLDITVGVSSDGYSILITAPGTGHGKGGGGSTTLVNVSEQGYLPSYTMTPYVVTLPSETSQSVTVTYGGLFVSEPLQTAKFSNSQGDTPALDYNFSMTVA